MPSHQMVSIAAWPFHQQSAVDLQALRRAIDEQRCLVHEFCERPVVFVAPCLGQLPVRDADDVATFIQSCFSSFMESSLAHLSDDAAPRAATLAMLKAQQGGMERCLKAHHAPFWLEYFGTESVSLCRTQAREWVPSLTYGSLRAMDCPSAHAKQSPTASSHVSSEGGLGLISGLGLGVVIGGLGCCIMMSAAHVSGVSWLEGPAGLGSLQ